MQDGGTWLPVLTSAQMAKVVFWQALSDGTVSTLCFSQHLSPRLLGNCEVSLCLKILNVCGL